MDHPGGICRGVVRLLRAVIVEIQPEHLAVVQEVVGGGFLAPEELGRPHHASGAEPLVAVGHGLKRPDHEPVPSGHRPRGHRLLGRVLAPDGGGRRRVEVNQLVAVAVLHLVPGAPGHRVLGVVPVVGPHRHLQPAYHGVRGEGEVQVNGIAGHVREGPGRAGFCPVALEVLYITVHRHNGPVIYLGGGLLVGEIVPKGPLRARIVLVPGEKVGLAGPNHVPRGVKRLHPEDDTGVVAESLDPRPRPQPGVYVRGVVPGGGEEVRGGRGARGGEGDPEPHTDVGEGAEALKRVVYRVAVLPVLRERDPRDGLGHRAALLGLGYPGKRHPRVIVVGVVLVEEMPVQVNLESPVVPRVAAGLDEPVHGYGGTLEITPEVKRLPGRGVLRKRGQGVPVVVLRPVEPSRVPLPVNRHRVGVGVRPAEVDQGRPGSEVRVALISRDKVENVPYGLAPCPLPVNLRPGVMDRVLGDGEVKVRRRLPVRRGVPQAGQGLPRVALRLVRQGVEEASQPPVEGEHILRPVVPSCDLVQLHVSPLEQLVIHI